MFKRFILVLSFWLLIFDTIQSEEDYNVGLQRMTFSDENRLAWNGVGLRPINVHIFYPTSDRSTEPKVLNSSNVSLHLGALVLNATPIKPRKMPMIVISSDAGSSSLGMWWLIKRLVNEGYIVLGINHHGSTSVESKKYVESQTLWWERTLDLHVAINDFTRKKQWAPYIDQERIGILGFALGGYTVISALGGITDRSIFEDFCLSKKRDTTCSFSLENSELREKFNEIKNSSRVKASLIKQQHAYDIAGIKAAVVIAPTLVQAFTRKSLKRISVPLAIVIGSEDEIAQAKTNARYLSKMVAGDIYHKVRKADHNTLSSRCDEPGREQSHRYCLNETHEKKYKIQQQVSKKIIEFLSNTL